MANEAFDELEEFDEPEAFPDLDLRAPSEARVYDYYLGGASNFAVDREFAERQIARLPTMRMIARENRRFLRRALRFQLDQGVRQFLDIGSGIPTVGNVHQVADQYAPGEAKVIYVDHDPIAERHAKALLVRDGDPSRHTVLCADLMDADLWQRIDDVGLLDFNQPVGLLLVAVVHFLTPEQKPEEPVAFLRDHLPSGSYLTFSHVTNDGRPPDERAIAKEIEKDYANRQGGSGSMRSRAEIIPFFGDWHMVDPGIVWTCEWRRTPDEPTFTGDPASSFFLAGVASKP